jgi:hypothetical protein
MDRLRPDLKIIRQVQRGEVSFIVKDPLRSNIFASAPWKSLYSTCSTATEITDKSLQHSAETE